MSLSNHPHMNKVMPACGSDRGLSRPCSITISEFNRNVNLRGEVLLNRVSATHSIFGTEIQRTEELVVVLTQTSVRLFLRSATNQSPSPRPNDRLSNFDHVISLLGP